MSVNLNKATSSPRRKPHILIVGGGAAGVGIAQRLSAALSKSASSYDLTLLTSRDYYLHLIGLLRPLVTPNDTLEKRILIPYDNIFAKSLGGPGSVKVGEVVSVAKNPQGKTGGSVTLQNGETIEWDVLVLTPGNKWEGGLDLPKTVEEAEEAIKEWRDRFRKAEHVVLVGGGAVGIELAGELRDEYPVRIFLFSSSRRAYLTTPIAQTHHSRPFTPSSPQRHLHSPVPQGPRNATREKKHQARPR
jgi:NADH dehydrogenase FAD-containing subunit